MNGENVTSYDDKLLFRDTVVVFMDKGDSLSMTTDLDINKTKSPNAKQIINFLDEVNFDIHAKGTNCTDKNLIENYYSKTALLASGLKSIFLSDNFDEICDRLG